MEPSKKDWKLFRERIGPWQEAYMAQLIDGYVKYLCEGEGPASEKFWWLDERLKEDRQHPGVRLELNKGRMIFDIATLLNDGVIQPEDLEGFSDELKEKVEMLCAK